MTAATPPTMNVRLSSLDHLISANEQRRRNRQAERLGRLHIDEQFEFRRLLDWQISGLCALENFYDIVRGSSVQIFPIDAVRHETTEIDEEAKPIHRRDAVPRGQLNDALTVFEQRVARQCLDCIDAITRHRSEALVDVSAATDQYDV